MSNYSINDFCTHEEGLDYIFARMTAIYGATFIRHFEGIDHRLIRREWISQLGRFLTYRPSLDYAINCLDPDFVPSAIKFLILCRNGPHIPTDPAKTLFHEKQETNPVSKEEIEKAKKRIKELKLLCKFSSNIN